MLPHCRNAQSRLARKHTRIDILDYFHLRSLFRLELDTTGHNLSTKAEVASAAYDAYKSASKMEGFDEDDQDDQDDQEGAGGAHGMRDDDGKAIPPPERTMSAEEKALEERRQKELVKQKKAEDKAKAEQEGATKMMNVMWKMTVRVQHLMASTPVTT